MNVDEISNMILRHIFDNWRKYAYVDNNKCIDILLTKLVKSMIGRRLDSKKLSDIYSTVVEKLVKMGYRVEMLRHMAKNRTTRLIICLPDG